MDKNQLAQQLVAKLRESVAVAERETVAAAKGAKHGATAKEKREDARMALEQGSLARGQARRAAQARMDLAALESFHPQPISSDGVVSMGAMIEVEDEDDGRGRTLFLAPAGAGIELTGPGGDGFFSVVTPQSPMGRAAMGKRLGDALEVEVAGETRYWEITWLA